MNDTSLKSRRDFARATAAITMGSLAAVPAPASADEPPKPPPRKPRVRIGARISPAWMRSPDDADLRFLKQIGVDALDIELVMVKGYQETGSITRAALRELTSRFEAAGLRIERANAMGDMILNAHLDRPEGRREIDDLKRIGEVLAEAKIPVYGIQSCQASLHVDRGRQGWSRGKGRGGYDHPAFDLAAAEASRPTPRYPVTADQLWKGLLNIYRNVIPVVEGSDTRVAMHGNDPPLYQHLGSPQILCRFADFDRLFSEVPSRHNAMTFCVGTRYESGEDVFEGIRRFGGQGKLCHVHFRNVRGTLPKSRGYEEVFVDDGDLSMANVLRALIDVGYDGVIDYDHPIGVTGDGPLPKQYVAFAVGYMRGLIQSLGG
ncbi:MAG: mannonate dehydratase [Isosphaeraceae bacterium]